MSAFRLVPANVVPPAQLHAAFSAAFADYLIGPFNLSLSQWPGFLARQAVSLSRSRVALRGDEVLALAAAFAAYQMPELLLDWTNLRYCG